MRCSMQIPEGNENIFTPATMMKPTITEWSDDS
jgi:hypothetical protein